MFWQVFIRSTTCRLNSRVCRRHFAFFAIYSHSIQCKVRLFGVSHFWGSVHFQCLFEFTSKKLKVAPSALMLEQLDAALVCSFLEHLETTRGNSAETRN